MKDPAGKLYSVIYLLFVLFLIVYAVFLSPIFGSFTNEDGIVENGTALFLILGAYFWMKVFILRRRLFSRFDILILLAGFFIFFAGAEEISWGQRIVNFRPVITVNELNDQREITLHNYTNIQYLFHYGVPVAIFALGGVLPVLTYIFKFVKRICLKTGIPLMPKAVCLSVWIAFGFFMYAIQVPFAYNNRRNVFDEYTELIFALILFAYIFSEYFSLIKHGERYGADV